MRQAALLKYAEDAVTESRALRAAGASTSKKELFDAIRRELECALCADSYRTCTAFASSATVCAVRTQGTACSPAVGDDKVHNLTGPAARFKAPRLGRCKVCNRR